MRILLLIFPVVLLLGACSGDRGRREDDPGSRLPLRGDPPLVRVRLSAAEGRDGVDVVLAGSYRVTEADDPDALLGEGRATGVVEARLSADGIVLDGVVYDEDPVRLDPGSVATLGVGSRTYRGAILLGRDGDALEAVLETEIETYLVGVVAGEMPASFGAAALEAQAVAARTYALDRILAREGDAWHLWDDTRSQMFVGLPPASHAAAFESAVARTRGTVLLFGSRIFSTYYHAACGGHTSSATETLGGPAIPPLSGVPCDDCRAAPRYRWEVRIPATTLAAAAEVPSVSGAAVLSRTGSGRADEIRIDGPAPRTIRAQDLRLRLASPNLPSTWIDTIEPSGGDFVFRGRGHGHGAGLCQHGAAGRARRGWTASDILRDYYPGATVSRVY